MDNNIEILKLIINNEREKYGYIKSINELNHVNNTPLDLANNGDNEEIKQLLIENGAKTYQQTIEEPEEQEDDFASFPLTRATNFDYDMQYTLDSDDED